MRKSSRHVGAAVLALPRVEDLRRVQEEEKMPKVEPVGQCPYCHHGLERREVLQQRDFRRMPIGQRVSPIVLLVFWGCTNGECRLMFWQHPRISEPRVTPFTAGDVEH